MPGPEFLKGNQLALHPVEPADYEFLYEHWNTPGIRHGTNRQEPITHSNIAAYVEEDESAVYLLPCIDETPVGLLWLFEIDEVASRTEIGYCIISDQQGEGYATEAAELGVQYAFDERNLNKVMARVFEGNEGSTRVLEKVGFEQEGCLREQYYVAGQYVDTYLYGLLADETSF